MTTLVWLFFAMTAILTAIITNRVTALYLNRKFNRKIKSLNQSNDNLINLIDELNYKLKLQN